ncbi:MAG: lysophospholipid acyltransferase family protein [Gammaproteobacteria bacterium]|nr:lysophospholipid acyltransferase family protein [Gammaproteobacteria bacterium]
MAVNNTTPFQLPAPATWRWAASAGERLLGLNTLDEYYHRRQPGLSSRAFLSFILDSLNITYQVAAGDLSSLPEQGPVVVVANHPFGAIEGVVLAQLLLEVRSDLKILANQYLHRIQELSDLFIGVDVFETEQAGKRNVAGIRQSIGHLKQGGVLLVFPAGEVSSLHIDQKKVTDREWNRIIGMMIRKTQAKTLPIYIDGHNSKLFHMAGMIHPRFRTMLLAREVLNKRNKQLSLHVGEAISCSELKNLSSDEAITQYMRLNTYLLASHASNQRVLNRSASQYITPVAVDIDKGLLQKNINRLSADRLLVVKDEYEVYCAPAAELEYVLPEIGRLRELTFRQVGEGAGLACDLDDYDQHYLHLFMWHKENQQVVGAYRLGLVDKLLAQGGIKKLYSRSLFNYNREFINSLGSSIEMGRSFIRQEYQRSISALLLLWKGIAAYAARHPQYTTLFGPVSISSDYSEMSRSLITSFLQIHHYDAGRADKVKPTNPQKKNPQQFWTRKMLSELGDSQLISKLIYRMEGDKGLPVLIRQYLSLKGNLVSFNIDRDFNDALDGMIIVDLLNVPEKVLAKYMGKTEAHAFLNR